jgi:hypothetical protein
LSAELTRPAFQKFVLTPWFSTHQI